MASVFQVFERTWNDYFSNKKANLVALVVVPAVTAAIIEVLLFRFAPSLIGDVSTVGTQPYIVLNALIAGAFFVLAWGCGLLASYQKLKEESGLSQARKDGVPLMEKRSPPLPKTDGRQARRRDPEAHEDEKMQQQRDLKKWWL